MILNCVETTKRVVAFTFDDGPDVNYTPQILDLFREIGGKATFFMIGNQVKANPELARRALAEGHEIGNHTNTHPNLTDLSPDEVIRELSIAAQNIKEVTGIEVRTFRPPYFGYNETVHSIVTDKFGYPAIGAMNMNATDWSNPGVEHIVEHSVDHLSAGSILIFHDGWGDRSQTVEAVRQLIHMAADRGYQMVTVSELLQLAACEV
ncbi:polysaccharide deacetylase family protein [Paenibacillus sp. PR3]|uniref:Polysaccharide deacetylase family protein n=1 Tax=Paenibacillus terricola TaxID=2763503 RepID=A0ABR8MTX6_9BACL|nr:polysaccharide deacetylase family protein [Paenibacillus terricola]MBD3918531.1 polysaccharide deacetylase family protein [Paenibacillus terricola]